MKFTTRTGDKGETDILNERVDKCCDIIELLGTIDESASVIAVARSMVDNDKWKDELSTVISSLTKTASFVCKKEDADMSEEIGFLEERISYYESQTQGIKLFEYPLKKTTSVIDYARCVVRRAERCAVRCKRDIRYLNRLSDYLFVLSRYIEYGE